MVSKLQLFSQSNKVKSILSLKWWMKIQSLMINFMCKKLIFQSWMIKGSSAIQFHMNKILVKMENYISDMKLRTILLLKRFFIKVRKKQRSWKVLNHQRRLKKIIRVTIKMNTNWKNLKGIIMIKDKKENKLQT